MSPMANMRSGIRWGAACLLTGMVLGLAGPRLVAADAGSAPARQQVHVVAPGDTLWALATSYAPDRDPREFIHEIKRLNGLSSVVLTPGERLILPSA